MAQISHTESFTAAMDPVAIRERVLGYFAPNGPKVITDTPDRLEVKSGSQLRFRLMGGAFIRPEALPTRTVIEMEPAGASTTVKVTASDAIGFGAKTGVKAKYRDRVETVTAELRAALTGSSTPESN